MKKIFSWLRRHLWFHRWHYRNPYCRTCVVCGRHEQVECWASDWNRGVFNEAAWWEVYNEGIESKHYER